jgi:hypothetical protein
VGQSANFGATTYGWSLIQDEHTDPPVTNDAEVAKSCYQGTSSPIRWPIRAMASRYRPNDKKIAFGVQPGAGGNGVPSMAIAIDPPDPRRRLT